MAASVAVDAKFLSIVAATPSITSAGSSGVTAANVLAHLTARVNAMTISADSRFVVYCFRRSLARRCHCFKALAAISYRTARSVLSSSQ